MSYSVEISDGATTYTFDVSRAPEWVLATTTEWDETKFPALLVKQKDTLTLRNCSFRDATPSNVTSDWSTIRSQLFDPATPIVSVQLKNGMTVADQIALTSVSGDHDQIVIRSLTPSVDVGFFANHWKGDIVIEGVIYHASAALAGSAGTPGEEDEIPAAGAAVAKRVRKLSVSHDQHGFETRRLVVTIEMVPGSGNSARAALALEALPLPGDNWFYETNDPLGGEDIDIEIDDDLTDLKGTGTCVVREQALNLPANANEFGVSVTQNETGSEKTLRTVVVAQADTLTAAETAATSGTNVPSEYAELRISRDKTKNRVTASFLHEADDTVRLRSWSIFAQGGGREREEIRMPSIGGKRDPIPFVRPKGVVRFRESIEVRRAGNPDIPVPSAFTDLKNVETQTNSDQVTIVRPSATPGQELYARRVQREHKFFSSPPDPAELVRRMTARPRPQQSATFGFKLARPS